MTRLALWWAIVNFTSVRADFYEDVSIALGDGADLESTLKIYLNRAVQRKTVLAPLYALWLNRMEDRSFGAALIGTVPDSDVMIIDAAEQSNQMVEGLQLLSKTVRSLSKMRSELKKAVAGPIFLFCMLSAMLVGFSYYLVPLLSQIIKPSTWPLIGRALYAVSEVITGNGPGILVVLITAWSAYVWSLPRWVGKSRIKADRYVPLYSIYRDYVGSIFLIALASLMRSGVGLAEALTLLAKRSSPWQRWHITRILDRLDKEAAFPANAFDTGIFNLALTDRVIDYGRRSKFDDAIAKVGLASAKKVTEYVAASAKSLNQLLILLCGATMIFMVSGVLLTAQEAQSSIMRSATSVR